MLSNRVGPRGRRGTRIDRADPDTASNGSVLGAVPFATASNIGESLDIRWFRHKLKQRVCNRFVLSDEKANEYKEANDRVCTCGYIYDDHTERAKKIAQESPPGPWDADADTYIQATNAFGEMEFVGYGQKISKYVRVADNTNMDILLDLLMTMWNLEKPNLVISVTGGAKNFTMKPRLKQVFNQGLMKAAKSTSAWIITGGMHAGVMKHVGEAVRTSELTAGSRNKATVIGIAPWGCVTNRPALVGHEGKWPAHYLMDTAPGPNESPLDMNHSHFILVDNGTQYKFATEIALRAKLEASVANLKSGYDVVSVPIVCVLLEGGPGSLETVKSAIENGTPAVVVQGSGRSADVISYAYTNAREEEYEVEEDGKIVKRCRLVMSEDVRRRVQEMVQGMFGDKSLDLWMGWVEKCIEQKDMLTIFTLETRDMTNDIDISLLTALLKAKKNRVQDQLKLALAWNRIDIAKTQIFSQDRHWKQEELGELTMAALRLGRDDFIQLFLENGLNMRQFLTLGRLLDLYNTIPKNCPLSQLLRRMNKDSTKRYTLKNIGALIKELMGDFFEPLYLKDPYRNYEKSKFPEQMETDVMDQLYQASSSEDGQYYDFSEPSRELFLWSVLMNMRRMSHLLWVEGKDPIAGALTASKLLRSMAEGIHETDIKKDLRSHADDFQKLALDVLHECYVAENEQAEYLLIREQPNFGDTTCLLLAVQGKNEDFVAHTCVQSLLNRIWRGKISPETSSWLLMLCVLCPVLIFPVVYFREDEAVAIKNREMPKTKHVKMIQKHESVSGEHSFSSKESQETMEKKEKRKEKMFSAEKLSKTMDIYDLGRKLTWSERVIYFYTAPITVFILNCISYLAFLLLFSYDVLVGFTADDFTVSELVLAIWVGTFMCEELRQMFSESSSLRVAIRIYFSFMLNVLDVASLSLFYVAFIMRFYWWTYPWPRYLMCLCLVLYYCRLLHIFSVFRQLGPMLIMIRRMIVNLFWFMLIMAVFVVAYGIVRQAILYPNTYGNFSGLLIYSVFRASYWQMQGEVEMFIGETESGSCNLVNGTLNGCSDAQLLVAPVMAVYILFTNVLMFNLLIAMFSFTFTAIQENTDRVWSFQRYSLIQEYFDRPPIPPPLIIIFHLWLLLRWVLSFCKPRFKEPWKGDCRITFTTNEEKIKAKQLVLWENMNADEYARKCGLLELETQEHKMQETRDKLELLTSKFDTLHERIMGVTAAISPSTSNQPTSNQPTSNQPSLSHPRTSLTTIIQPSQPSAMVADVDLTILEAKVQALENKLDRTNNSLSWIIDHLKERSRRVRPLPKKLAFINAEPVTGRPFTSGYPEPVTGLPFTSGYPEPVTGLQFTSGYPEPVTGLPFTSGAADTVLADIANRRQSKVINRKPDLSVTPRDVSVAPRDVSVTPRDVSVAPRDVSVAPRVSRDGKDDITETLAPRTRQLDTSDSAISRSRPELAEPLI